MERSFAAPIKMVPRRVRPVAPPQPSLSAQDILMQIANGHGRAAQERPKTPMRGLRPLPPNQATVAENKIDNPIAETEVASAAQSPERPAEVIDRRANLNSPFLHPTWEEFDFYQEQTLRRRPRSRLFRFIVFELFAIGVLIPSAWLVLSGAIADPSLLMLMNILAIGVAASAVIVPIILFAVAPAIPRDH